MLPGNNVINLPSILIMNFSLIKAFGIQMGPPHTPNITEVIWSPPKTGWVKGNCEGTFYPNTNISGCGGIFRNNNGDFLLAFIEKLQICSSITAEFLDVLKLIDIAKSRGC